MKNKIFVSVLSFTLQLFFNLVNGGQLEDNLNIEQDNTNEFKHDIANEIDNYLLNVQKTFGFIKNEQIHTNKFKRNADAGSTMMNLDDVYIFKSFNGVYKLPAHFPNDVILFCLRNITSQSSEDCYGVALESDEGSVIHSNYLVLYKFENTTDAFTEVDRVFIKYGVKLSTQLINNFQYVVVAECNVYNVTNISEGALIYKINQERSKFELVQTLNDKYLSDVIIWEQKNMNNAIFMAVATNSTDGYQWNTESYIYKWLGTYFDKVDLIKTHSPKSITTFTIGSSMYLAVANYQNNYGETDIDSEIFRYNVDKEKFLLHQKLRTHAAVDIKYFCFEDNSVSVFPRKESFLVVANNFVKDSDGGRNYDTYSVIYKFTEDEYFIPFQTVNVVAPVQWLPISEGRDKFLLLVASEIYGIKAFQYNGWRFVETAIRYSKGSFGPGIVSMRQYLFNHKNVLLISNKRKEGDSDNIFTISYERDNKLRKFYSKLETFCNITLDDVKEHNIVISKMLKSVKDMPRVTDPLIEVNDTIIFNNDGIQIKNIVTEIHEETVEGKAFEFDYSEIDDFVNEKNFELETLKRNFEVHPSHSFQGTENLSTAEFECRPYPCIFNDLYIETLNGENFTSFLKNALKLRENLTINSENVPLEFENIAVVYPIDVDYINNHKLSDLITYGDLSNLNQKLIVRGNVIIENNNGIFVNGKIDGIHIANDSVLLKSGYQNLTGKTLMVESLNVDILNISNTLNGVQLSDLMVNNNNSDKLFKRYDKSESIIDTVVVDELMLTDGQLSGVNFNDFFKNTMKLNATKQIVTGSHSYDKLVADEIHVDGNVIESKISVIIDTNAPQNNYSRIDTVEIRPGYSAHYPFNMSADNFSRKSLESGNDTITDGRVIDKNSKENGTNEKVNTNESSKYHKHAPSRDRSRNKENLRKLENVHDEDVTIQEDVVIDGKLIIRGATLNVENLMFFHENINVTNLINDAVRLDQDNIDVDFIFNTSVKSETLKVETINGIKPESWIMKNNTNNYNVTGHKIFTGDLYFNDGVILNGKINGISVTELANGAKKLLQNLEKLEIQSKADLSSGSLIDSNAGNFETDDEIFLTGTVIVKNNIHVQSLGTHSDTFVNGVHLKELMNKIANDSYDTMEFGSPQIFTKDLIIDNLYCNHLDAFNITEIRNMHYCHLYGIDSDDRFLNYFHNKSVVAENLKFTGNLDGVSAEEFGKWLLRKGDQEIVGLQTFNSVEARNGINVTSSVVNNVNIKDLAEDGVKIDQLVELTGITFDGLVTSTNVEVKGLINNINITDDAVLKNMSSSPKSPVIITGQKVLVNDLVANEINMPSVNKLCELFSVAKNQLLSINGSIRFSKEPIVEVLNNVNMTTLSDFAWFIYEDKTINSSVTFMNVTFLNDIDLKGTLNGVNVTQLNKEYFSLTKSQKVLTPIQFSGGIETKGQIHAAKLRVGRFVNGINLEHFYNNVLVDGKEQVIISVLDFQNVTFKGDFRTTGQINGLDLASDVLILNEEDLNQGSNKTILVKGVTKIGNVVTEELLIPNNSVNVQHININEWFKLAVKKRGTYVINGSKTLSNGINIIGNVSVDGSVNSMRFDEDNLLLTRGDQILTGFNWFDELSNVTIRNLNTYNLINDYNITDLIERQVYNTEDAVVTGNKTFLSNITAVHITLPEFYGSLNLSKLNSELTNYRDFKAYLFENEFESLKNIKKNVEISIIGQAYILKEFELKQRFKGNVHAVIPLKPQGHSTDEDLIGVITWSKQSSKGRTISRTQVYHLTIHKWDTEAHKFQPLPGFRNHMSNVPTLISPISTHENENGLKYGKFFMVFSNPENSQQNVSRTNKTLSSTDSASDVSFEGWIFNWDATLSKPLRIVQPIPMKHFGSLIHVYDSCYLLQEQIPAAQCHLYCGNNLAQTLNCTNNIQSIVTSDGNTTFVIFPKKIHGQHDYLNSTVGITKMDIMKFNSDARKLESIKSVITRNFTLSLSAIYDSDKQEHVMAVSAESLTVFRFSHNWDMISNFTTHICNDTTTDKHVKTSIKMKILPSNELIIFTASPCCKPKSLIWVGGLSDPKIIPMNIHGNEIKEVIPFYITNRNKSTKERLYIVVTDMATVVFKPVFTTN